MSFFVFIKLWEVFSYGFFDVLVKCELCCKMLKVIVVFGC